MNKTSASLKVFKRPLNECGNKKHGIIRKVSFYNFYKTEFSVVLSKNFLMHFAHMHMCSHICMCVCVRVYVYQRDKLRAC